MNYLDTVKFDEEKRKYVDAFGYVIEPLKNIRFTEKANEELEESKDNIITLEGGKTGRGVTVSALLSKDNNVDLFLEPKGTGSSIATSDIVSNFYKENQVRISSDNANLGIISTEGIDSTVHLDLRAKGSGANISMRNNLSVGGLNVRTDYPTNTGVSLEAQSNNATCDIYIKPKSGIVNVPAQIQSTFGYMMRRHTVTQYLPAAESIINFNTAVEDTFGSSATWTSNAFKNVSGVTMKVFVHASGMPYGVLTANSNSSIRVFTSGGSVKYDVGRSNALWSGTRYNTFSSTATVILQNNESFSWRIYTSSNPGPGLVGVADDPNEAATIMITQIP